MRISLATYIRMLVATPQFKGSLVIQKFVSEIGKKDPHLKNTDPDELSQQFLATIKPLVGHGMSQDKFDEVNKKLQTMNTSKEIMRYITNFMLSGAGMAVQADIEAR